MDELICQVRPKKRTLYRMNARHVTKMECQPPASLPPPDLVTRKSDFLHEFQTSEVGTESEAINKPLEAEGEVDEEEDDREEEVPSPPLRQYNKAKPLPEKENKFTSTLRRLSTVRYVTYIK